MRDGAILGRSIPVHYLRRARLTSSAKGKHRVKVDATFALERANVGHNIVNADATADAVSACRVIL